MQRTNTKKNIFELVTTIYIYLMLTVFLFYCGAGGYQEITHAKFHAFCLICGGYILVMAVLALESVVVGTIKLQPPVEALKASSWPQRLVLIYIGLTWISALLSPYFPETVLGVSRYEGALTITIYGICFLLVSIFGKVSKPMLWVLGAAVSLFSILCLVQMAGFNPFGLYPDGVGYADAYIKYSGAYLGTVGNVDLVAALLCLVIPILWVAILRLSGKLRFMLFMPLVAALAVLIQMNVLAGLVGVFVGGIVMIPIVAPISPKYKKIIWIVFAVLAVAGVVGLFAVDVGSGFLHELHELLHGRAEVSFGSGRFKIWSQVLQELPSNFLLGTGPDTMYRAGLEGFTRFDEALDAVLVAEIDVAHNEYLNVLFHQGILAFLAYVGALGLMAVKWFRESSKDAVVAILGGAALCYSIQAFFGFSMCITAPFFWLVLGLLESRSVSKDTGGRKK